MHTLIRDQETTTHDFVFYSDRLIRLVVEHGLGHLPFTEKQVITPTGTVFTVGIVVMMVMTKKSLHLSMIFLGFRVYG
jgi:uracil phosphoribosyltransferase